MKGHFGYDDGCGETLSFIDCEIKVCVTLVPDSPTRRLNGETSVVGIGQFPLGGTKKEIILWVGLSHKPARRCGIFVLEVLQKSTRIPKRHE